MQKRIRILLISLFWIAILILARSQRFSLEKNPYIMITLFVVFLCYIYYESIYKKNKIDNRKEEIKVKHLNEIKSNISEYTPSILENDLPNELKGLYPIFLKWGIENKILRDDLYESSPKSDLLKLKEVENFKDEILRFIDSSEEKISKPLQLTLQAYDDLGLWTWN